MKKVIVTLTLLMLATAAWSQTSVRMEITDQSSMVINGHSTLHDWKAFVNKVSGYVYVQLDGKKIKSIDAAELFVSVSDMEAKNTTMNTKMVEALKAKENPTIRYSLYFVNLNDRGTLGQTKGILTVAGITRPVLNDVELRINEENGIEIKGSFELSMGAFGMTPPTAMMGAIKTSDMLRIDFVLSGERVTVHAQK